MKMFFAKDDKLQWQKLLCIALACILVASAVIIGVVSLVQQDTVFAVARPRVSSELKVILQDELTVATWRKVQRAYVRFAKSKSLPFQIDLEGYYGNYGGAEVLFLNDPNMPSDQEETVVSTDYVDYRYKTGEGQIVVYHGGEVLTLQQALNLGLFDSEDMRYISKNHSGSKPKTTHDWQIDDYLVETILLAHMEATGSSRVDSMNCYYGCYNNVHVFRVYGFGTDGYEIDYYYNMEFLRPSSYPTHVYKDGYVCTLPEAVEQGIMTKDDMYKLFSLGECKHALVELTQQKVDDILLQYAQRQQVDVSTVEIFKFYTIIGNNILLTIKGAKEGVGSFNYLGEWEDQNYIVSATVDGKQVKHTFGGLYTYFVYNNGTLYTLQEAVDLGVVDFEDFVSKYSSRW